MKDFAEATADVYKWLVSNAVLSSMCWKNAFHLLLKMSTCLVVFCVVSPEKVRRFVIVVEGRLFGVRCLELMTYFEDGLWSWTVCWWWASCVSTWARTRSPGHQHVTRYVENLFTHSALSRIVLNPVAVPQTLPRWRSRASKFFYFYFLAVKKIPSDFIVVIARTISSVDHKWSGYKTFGHDLLSGFAHKMA